MEGRFDTFTTVIASMYQSIQKIKTMEMEKYGLRSGHVTCLHHLLAHQDGLTLKELTALCAIDKAAISRNLTALQEHGFVETKDQENKKYNLRWTLTTPGKEAAEEIDARIARAVSAGGDFMTEKEREQFYPWILKIAGNLQEYVKRMEQERKSEE